MDHLGRMRLFVRVVERESFSAAATDLGLSRSTATEAVKGLEAHLGTRLLERTTRHVAPTLDGADYYRRCLSILSDLDEAESELRSAEPRGLLRVDAHGLMTRTFLLPGLPDFLARYPLIDLHLGQGDRLVDLVREGVDCVIRAGEPADSSMIRRKLGTIREITVASPDYLARHGTPLTPDDLEGHAIAGFVSSLTGDVLPLEFMQDGKLRHVRLPARVTANDSDTMTDLARLGFGLIQAPAYRFADDLRHNRLVEVLADYPPSPTPFFALYPQNRRPAARLRVFLEWVSAMFARADL
ncbi:MAG: LysR family transcriptional regulator [Methylobacterium mesophilicum]|nr:LysR family transcriptional regulator [Methylobacterium mesophilicum]